MISRAKHDPYFTCEIFCLKAIKVGKFANKNLLDQIFEEKNTLSLPRTMVFVSKIMCLVHFFVVFNVCVCKTSLFFLAISKKR